MTSRMQSLPHVQALAEFVLQVQTIYGLDGTEGQALSDSLNGEIIAAAILSAHRSPLVDTAKTLVAQGVQDGAEFMRPDEVGTALGIPVSTMCSWRKRGEGPAFRKIGRDVLYRRDDVRAWVDAQSISPTQTAAPKPLRDSLGLINGSQDPSEMSQ